MNRTFCRGLFIIAFFFGCSEPSASRFSSSPQARRFFDLPHPHEATVISPDHLQKLKDSVLERRHYAWSVVAKVLQEISAGNKWRLPAWSSWYGADDFRRVFDKLFFDLGEEGRSVLRPIFRSQIEQAEIWNTKSIKEVWSESDYEKWGKSLEDQQQVQGLSGLQRIFFDRAVLQHVIENYPKVHLCRANPKLSRSGDNRTECFDGEFPRDAVLVKASWVRADASSGLPVYATDAEGLQRTFHANQWKEGDTRAHPSDDQIFIAKPSGNVPGRNKYWMPALHIMSKELPDWAWITLWWSSEPDSDFGEDRPQFIRDLGGPWSNYKMCIAVDYEDLGNLLEVEEQYPSLAAALQYVKTQAGPFSWCSNPYIEKGQKNHQTNCIGCHQHGGANLDPTMVLTDEQRFPNGGRSRARQTFPADYLWSFKMGEVGFANFIEDTIKDYKNHDNGLE